MKKIAVVLMNLGGPDEPASIAPFLKNFFMDKAIIGAPYPVRFLLSRLISWRRSRAEAGSAYGMLGGRSPLLSNTKAQATELGRVLNQQGQASYTVHVTMRYWHPMADQVVQEVMAQHPDQIILLPLYPQFSTTTTGSSFTDWDRAARVAGLATPTVQVCCYPDQDGFIKASADQVRIAYNTLVQEYPHTRPPRVLFSAHGLPEKIIRRGDPYQAQCEKTSALIAEATDIPNLDWQICYQSRVGPLKWIGPSTQEALARAALDHVPVVIYPPAFVSEHVETLVEIEHEYRDRANKLGVPAFARAETVMTHPRFIEGLAQMVRDACGRAPGTVAPAGGLCQCGSARQCPMFIQGVKK